jgi:hypothetical protein
LRSIFAFCQYFDMMLFLLDSLTPNVLLLSDDGGSKLRVLSSVFKCCEQVFINNSSSNNNNNNNGLAVGVAVVNNNNNNNNNQTIQVAALNLLKSVASFVAKLPCEPPSSALHFANQHWLALASGAAAQRDHAPLALVNVCWKALRTRAAQLTEPGPKRSDVLRVLLNAVTYHAAAAMHATTSVLERHLKLIRFYLPAFKDFVHLDTSAGKRNAAP